MIKKTYLILTMLLPALNMSGGNIYVAPNGNDNGNGTLEEPLSTPAAALKMAREWRRTKDTRTEGGINIILREGTYIMGSPLFIRPDDRGSAESPLVIKSMDGEKAVLSGGNKDGKKIENFSYPELRRMSGFDTSRKAITVTWGEDIESIKGMKTPAMMVHQRWAIAILRIADVKTEGNKAEISFMEPEASLEFSHPWPQPVIGGEMGNSSYCIIDLDKMPQKDYANNLVCAIGSAEFMVENIHFKDLVFENTSWKRVQEQGIVSLQAGFPLVDAYKLKVAGTKWSNTLENQAWIERPEAAVTLVWTKNTSFEGCEFRNLAATALDIGTGCRKINIRNNKFHDIGGSGIVAGSFQESPVETHIPYCPNNDDEYVDNIIIKDNKVERVSVLDWGTMAIGCGYVRDTEITDNYVSDCNWSGICVGWGWTSADTGMRNNKVTGNSIDNFAMQMHDDGAIYTLSAQPGSIIAGNKAGKHGEAPYATNERVFPVYLDDSSDGFTFENNNFNASQAGTNNNGKNIIWK